MKKVALACVVAASLGAATACDRSGGATGAAGDSTVAATVNGKKIAMGEVDRLLNAQVGGQSAQLSPLELAQGRLGVLENLIQQEVLFQRAEKEKLLPSEDDINQALAALKQGMTEEEYQRRLQETGQNEQAVREEVRRRLALERLQNKNAANIGTIRDKEVDDFYDQNKEQFVNRRGASLAAIVVDPRDNGAQDDAKSDAEATVKANTIYQRLRSGADFATVARASSEDQTNVRGGDLGFLAEEQMRQAGFPAELVNRFMTQMNPGDITEPVKTPDGRLTIFKLQGKQLQNENLTKENPQVRDQIKQTLIGRRQSLLNAVLLEVAMNEADVKNILARDVLTNKSDLSGIRPANAPGASPSPAASASPQSGAQPAAQAPPAASPRG